MRTKWHFFPALRLSPASHPLIGAGTVGSCLLQQNIIWFRWATVRYLSTLGTGRRGASESTSLVSSIRTSRMSPLCISALPSQLTDTGAHSASSLSSLSQSGCTWTVTQHRYYLRVCNCWRTKSPISNLGTLIFYLYKKFHIFYSTCWLVIAINLKTNEEFTQSQCCCFALWKIKKWR